MKILTIIKTIFLKAWLRCIDSDTYVDYLRRHGITVGQNVRFRYPAHTLIDMNRPTLVEFGSNIDVNDNFVCLTHDFGTYVLRGKYKEFVNSSGKIKIGNNIVFGRNVTVLKGVEIGDNTIVALGAVVTKSTPPNSVIGGVPARVLCTIDEYYKRRKAKSVSEALEYGASILKVRIPQIEDFYEEWCLFLTKDEYNKNEQVRHFVDYRLNGYADKEDFFSKPKPFTGFQEFLKEIKEYDSVNKLI